MSSSFMEVMMYATSTTLAMNTAVSAAYVAFPLYGHLVRWVGRMEGEKRTVEEVVQREVVA